MREAKCILSGFLATWAKSYCSLCSQTPKSFCLQHYDICLEICGDDMEMPSTTLQTAVISSLPRHIRENHMMGIICQKGQSIPYISPSPLQLVSWFLYWYEDPRVQNSKVYGKKKPRRNIRKVLMDGNNRQPIWKRKKTNHTFSVDSSFSCVQIAGMIFQTRSKVRTSG